MQCLWFGDVTSTWLIQAVLMALAKEWAVRYLAQRRLQLRVGSAQTAHRTHPEVPGRAR